MLEMLPLVLSVTVMEFRAEFVTVTVVVPVMEELLVAVAVMVAVPALIAFARPLASIVAMVVSEEVQVTFTLELVLPSSFVPVAVNCCV